MPTELGNNSAPIPCIRARKSYLSSRPRSSVRTDLRTHGSINRLGERLSPKPQKIQQVHTEEIEYLDGKFTVNGQDPDTLEELAQVGFGEPETVAEAVSNLRYRNKYPRVYKKVSADLITEYSFPRAVESTKTLKDGTVRHVHESVNDHIRAAVVGRKDEAGNIIPGSMLENAETILLPVFQKYESEEPLYVKGERTGLGGKISEAALKQANDFFAVGPDKVEKVAAFIEEKVPGYKVGRDVEDQVTPESLARAISALQKKLAADATAAAKAALGAVG
jgi:hypothetical protein